MATYHGVGYSLQSIRDLEIGDRVLRSYGDQQFKCIEAVELDVSEATADRMISSTDTMKKLRNQSETQSDSYCGKVREIENVPPTVLPVQSVQGGGNIIFACFITA